MRLQTNLNAIASSASQPDSPDLFDLPDPPLSEDRSTGHLRFGVQILESCVARGLNLELASASYRLEGSTMVKTHRFLIAPLFAGLVAIATPGCAEQYYGYGQHGGNSRNVDRRAYDIGYREGLDHGQDDARRGRDFA